MGWAEMVTDEQLLSEVHRRFSGRCCVWQDEDVAAALRRGGFAPTEENVDAVWSHMGGHALADRMTEEGWYVIDYAIAKAEDDLTKVEED